MPGSPDDEKPKENEVFPHIVELDENHPDY